MAGTTVDTFSLEKEGTFLGSYEADSEQEKDSLLFHGVPWICDEAKESGEELEEKIKELIRTEYGIECTEKMETVCRFDNQYMKTAISKLFFLRWTDGPKVNGFPPVLIVFKE